MAQVNPYAAPKAAVEDVQQGQPELATRWQRFAAAFVDNFVLAIAGGIAGGLAAALGGRPEGGAFIVAVSIAIALVGAINLWMVHRYRASIGKRALKLRMVRKDGSEAELWRLIFARGMPQWLLGLGGQFVPLLNVLVLVDVLFIFGRARRCVHDYIGDTIVVQAG